MKTIGISEIQKNTSIFNNLTEAIEIVDKRKKQTVAVVYPVTRTGIVNKLAGKYKNKVLKSTDLTAIKESAMRLAMEDKYGDIN